METDYENKLGAIHIANGYKFLRRCNAVVNQWGHDALGLDVGQSVVIDLIQRPHDLGALNIYIEIDNKLIYHGGNISVGTDDKSGLKLID